MKKVNNLATTEFINPRFKNLDAKSTLDLINLMHKEDQKAVKAVYVARYKLKQLIGEVTSAFRLGGRLFYVGAGTSGRLGMLDAAECPPTFGVSSKMVQGIIAGGNRALKKALENVEDDVVLGKQIIKHNKITRDDIVIGISASGSAAFVRSALGEAKRLGANAWLITCNNKLLTDKSYGKIGLDGVIVLDTGPEIIAGSTRLKAGTATKLVLNMISTISMVHMGMVLDNIMVGVVPANVKLRNRACRIISDITKCSLSEAARLLKISGNKPKIAIVMKVKDVKKEQAEQLLAKYNGCLRKVLAWKK